MAGTEMMDRDLGKKNARTTPCMSAKDEFKAGSVKWDVQNDGSTVQHEAVVMNS